VSSGAIIEALDEFKGNASSLRSCLEIFSINAFPFEAMKKAFHGRIIVPISSTAHAHYHCIGYLEHPFKNKPFETEKELLSLLANTGRSV
jgi:hypothetical protein